jgi:hypothetical protein
MAIDVLAQSIRDAIAPVFLMSGVATVLNVTTSRFSRIVDRYRTLMGEGQTDIVDAEMLIMLRRSHVIHWSIACCTSCALLVCLLIAVLFISAELGFSPIHITGFLFVMSMIALVAGLLLFLYEVHLATGTVAILSTHHKSRHKKT